MVDFSGYDAPTVFYIFLIAIVIFFLIIWGTQGLWNMLIPSIFGLREISYWETFGLMILSMIFIKSSNFK